MVKTIKIFLLSLMELNLIYCYTNMHGAKAPVNQPKRPLAYRVFWEFRQQSQVPK